MAHARAKEDEARRATLSSKRAALPSALSTPPVSPTSPAKRIRLTYSSLNEAWKDLNKAKEEASLAHLIAQSRPGDPTVVDKWAEKDRTFLAVGPLGDHDCLIKKEVLDFFPGFGIQLISYCFTSSVDGDDG